MISGEEVLEFGRRMFLVLQRDVEGFFSDIGEKDDELVSFRVVDLLGDDAEGWLTVLIGNGGDEVVCGSWGKLGNFWSENFCKEVGGGGERDSVFEIQRQ